MITHKELIAESTTYSDYISLALANGWSDIQITETLSSYVQSLTGVNTWSMIKSLCDEYTEKYGENCKLDYDESNNPVDYTNYKKGGNPNFIAHKRAIKYNGVEYESMAQAARSEKVSKRKIEWAIGIGSAAYV